MILARCLSPIPAKSSEKQYWRFGSLVENKEGVQVDDKHHVWDLQKKCRSKTRKIPERVPEAVVQVFGLVAGAKVTTPPGAGLIIDPRIEMWTGQLASIMAEAVLLTAKLSNLKDACKKIEREHKSFV